MINKNIDMFPYYCLDIYIDNERVASHGIPKTCVLDIEKTILKIKELYSCDAKNITIKQFLTSQEEEYHKEVFRSQFNNFY